MFYEILYCAKSIVAFSQQSLEHITVAMYYITVVLLHFLLFKEELKVVFAVSLTKYGGSITADSRAIQSVTSSGGLCRSVNNKQHHPAMLMTQKWCQLILVMGT